MSESKELQQEREKIEKNVAQFMKLVPTSLMYLFKDPEDFELHRIDSLWEENVEMFSVDSMKKFLEFVLSMKPNTICQLVECFNFAKSETINEAKTSHDVFDREHKESRQERHARWKHGTNVYYIIQSVHGGIVPQFFSSFFFQRLVYFSQRYRKHGRFTTVPCVV